MICNGSFDGSKIFLFFHFYAEVQLHDGEITQAHALDVETRLARRTNHLSWDTRVIWCFFQQGEILMEQIFGKSYFERGFLSEDVAARRPTFFSLILWILCSGKKTYGDFIL